MVNIIKGRMKSGKSEKILEYIRDELDKYNKPMLLVPSRTQRDYFIQKLASNNGFAGKTVYTFDEAVSFVIASEGGNFPSITGFESFILLKLIIEENKKKFVYFKNIGLSSGIIRLIYEIIIELRAGIILNKNLNFSDCFQDSGETACQKWMDIQLIYSEYEKRLSERNLYDNYRLMFKAGEILQNKGYFSETFLVIDGFFDFTAVQFHFLKSLIKSFEKENKKILFTLLDSNISLIENTLKQLTENFNVEITELSGKIYNFAGLAHSILEGRLSESGGGPNTPTGSGVSGTIVQTIEAFGKYREIELIANEIKKMKLENDYSYNDIALILRRPEDYKRYISSVFREFEIPYYSSRDEKLKNNPVIIYLYSIIKSALKDKAIDNTGILGLVNSNYMSNEEFKSLSGILEIFPSYKKSDARGWIEESQSRLNYLKELRAKSFLEEDETGFPLENIQEQIRLAEILMPPLEKLLLLIFSLPDKFTMNEFINWLGILIKELGIEKALGMYPEEQASLTAKDYNVFRKLKETLLSLKLALKIYSKEIYGKDEFFSLFNDLMEDLTYRFQYYPVDSVKILTPFDARETDFKAVFIAGLNEGEFPGRETLSLADNSEKKRFNSFANRIIFNHEEEKENTERLDFAVALSRAGEKLYLTRTPFEESGREILPSIFYLNALRNAGLTDRENKNKMFEIVPSESWMDIYDLKLLISSDFDKIGKDKKIDLSKKYQFIDFVEKMNRYYLNIGTINNYYDNLPDRVNIEIQPDTEIYKMFFGRLDFSDKSSAGIHADIGNVISNRDYVLQKVDKMTFSSSRLETFGNCRYQFFIKYILNIIEESYPAQKLESRFKGLFYHAVLKDYVEKTKDKNGEEIIDNLEIYYKILDDAVEKNFQEFLNKEGEKELFYLEKGYYRTILRNFIEYDARILRDFRPFDFELQVNTSINIQSKKEIKFNGKIDRVDENKGFYRVIDYKSGSVAHFKDDFKIPLKLFQGFLYARSYDKPINEISYISLEKNGRDKKKIDVLPYKDRWNRHKKQCELVLEDFDSIWKQKESEIGSIFGLIEDGNFLPYSTGNDFDEPLLDFYKNIIGKEEIDSFESDFKCKLCPYTDACLRRNKLMGFEF